MQQRCERERITNRTRERRASEREQTTYRACERIAARLAVLSLATQCSVNAPLFRVCGTGGALRWRTIERHCGLECRDLPYSGEIRDVPCAPCMWM